MKRNLIIILIGLLCFYYNPLSAQKNNFELKTDQDSLNYLKNSVDCLKQEIDLLEAQRVLESLKLRDQDIMIEEQNEILLEYKIIFYIICLFSILMIVLNVFLILKNRKLKKILSKQK